MLCVSSCVPVTWLCSRVTRFQPRLATWPLLTIESLLAQWLEHPTRSGRVEGSNSIGHGFFPSYYYSSTSSCCCFIFNIYSLNLKLILYVAKLTQNTRVYGEWAPLTSKSAFVCLNCLNFSIFRYGDRCPRTFSARAFAIVWLLVSMVLFSFFMGTISSILTVTVMRSRTTEVYSGGNKVVRATRLILAPLFHLSSHT